MSKVHIGKKIKEVFEESSFKKMEDFAKKIGVTRDGAYKIFQKESIALDQLQKISDVLRHDFFSYYRVTLAQEKKPEYGYAAKEDVETLTRMVNTMAKQMEKMQQDLARLVDPKKPAKKKSK